VFTLLAFQVVHFLFDRSANATLRLDLSTRRQGPPWLLQNVRFLPVNQLEECVPGATILQDVLEVDIKHVERCVYLPSSSSSSHQLNLYLVGHHAQYSKQSIDLVLFALQAACEELAAQDPRLLRSEDGQQRDGGFGAYDVLDVKADDVRARSILKGLGFRRRRRWCSRVKEVTRRQR
jgi:hypothetical protein